MASSHFQTDFQTDLCFFFSKWIVWLYAFKKVTHLYYLLQQNYRVMKTNVISTVIVFLYRHWKNFVKLATALLTKTSL